MKHVSRLWEEQSQVQYREDTLQSFTPSLTAKTIPQPHQPGDHNRNAPNDIFRQWKLKLKLKPLSLCVCFVKLIYLFTWFFSRHLLKKQAGKTIGSDLGGTGMHLGAPKFSSQYKCLWEFHFIYSHPWHRIEADRKSHWWMITYYPVSLCPRRKLSVPDFPGDPEAFGSDLSLCRLEGSRVETGSHPSPPSTKLFQSAISPGSPYSQWLRLPQGQWGEKGTPNVGYYWSSLQNKCCELIYYIKKTTWDLLFYWGYTQQCSLLA